VARFSEHETEQLEAHSHSIAQIAGRILYIASQVEDKETTDLLVDDAAALIQASAKLLQISQNNK
jgi:hypothetical protein